MPPYNIERITTAVRAKTKSSRLGLRNPRPAILGFLGGLLSHNVLPSELKGMLVLPGSTQLERGAGVPLSAKKNLFREEEATSATIDDD